MPLPVIANTFRVAILQDVDGNQVINVIHCTGSDGPAVASDVGQAWAATGSIVDGVQTADIQSDSVEVLKLDGVSASINVVPAGWPIVGGQSGSCAPLQVAGVITLKTSLGGRSHRGRMYICGAQDDSIDGTRAQWALAAMPSFQAAADAFLAAMSSSPGGSELVVASYRHSTEQAVNAVVWRQRLGTQRRRVN